MLQFIRENLVTIIIASVIAVLVILALRRIIKDKRAGVGSCGYKCSECPRSGNCSLDEGKREE